MIVEQEDALSKELRELREEQEAMELTRRLEQDDLSWEERKKMERELHRKKRRRLDSEKDDTGEEIGKKTRKRFKYAILEDDWGEENQDRDDRDKRPPPPQDSLCNSMCQDCKRVFQDSLGRVAPWAARVQLLTALCVAFLCAARPI